MRRIPFAGKLLILTWLIAPEICSASASVRYLIDFPGHQLPFDISTTIANSQGRIVRKFPGLGIAIAVSSNGAFASTVARKLAIPTDFITTVPRSQLAPVKKRPIRSTVSAADTYYKDGLLWGVRRVHADLAWKVGFTGSHKTVVAVVDTGIAWNHPDLKPNVVLAKCFTSEATCNPYPSLSDHGTHVAGIIAGAFGGGAVVGVGPNLALASYNIFEYVDECGICSYEDSRWSAMMDAADKGFAVINVSQGATYTLGGRGSNQIAAYRSAEKKVLDYVNRAGSIVVASAGNADINLSGPLLHLPGDASGYVNVGATAIRPRPRYGAATYDVRAYYSNYGAPLTLSAPGGDCGANDSCDPIQEDWLEYLIVSTVVLPEPFCAATASCLVGYDWKSGTSMAAAHVSGVAGLVRDARPQLKPQSVTSLLKSTADSGGARLQFGHGIVNAFEAVKRASSWK